MMQEFMKLLSERQQKQGGPRKGRDMEAKAAMAKELSDMLGEDLTEGIKDSKRVTVASDSEEGLKKGLEKAEDILESKMEDESDMEDESEMESKSEDEAEDEMDSEEKIRELEKQIEELKAKRK